MSNYYFLPHHLSLSIFGGKENSRFRYVKVIIFNVRNVSEKNCLFKICVNAKDLKWQKKTSIFFILPPFQKDPLSKKKIVLKDIFFTFSMYYLMKNCKFQEN